MARQYDGKVAVIGVAARDDETAMKAFVKKHDLGHVPNVADPDGEVWNRLGVVGQPTWVFVEGTTGKVTKHVGILDEDELTERLDALLAT